MKNKKMVSILVAVVIFILALINPLGGDKNSISEEDLVAAIFVKEGIEQQTIITDEMIYSKKVHKDSVPASASKSKEEIVGKVSIVSMFKDEIIMTEKIDSVGSDKSGLSFIVEEGQRAITINVEKSQGLAGLLKIGNRVDVIANLPKKVGQDEELISTMLLQDKEILALDKTINFGKKEAEETIYETVTLSVTPEEALKLGLAEVTSNGMHLLLRNQDESQMVNIRSMSVKDIAK